MPNPTTTLTHLFPSVQTCRTLRPGERRDTTRPGGVWAAELAALKNAPSLATLTLNLHGTSMGDTGAEAVAALAAAPLLHSLTLNLDANSVGERGAQSLAALRDAPSNRDSGLRYADTAHP